MVDVYEDIPYRTHLNTGSLPGHTYQGYGRSNYHSTTGSEVRGFIKEFYLPDTELHSTVSIWTCRTHPPPSTLHSRLASLPYMSLHPPFALSV